METRKSITPASAPGGSGAHGNIRTPVEGDGSPQDRVSYTDMAAGASKPGEDVHNANDHAPASDKRSRAVWTYVLGCLTAIGSLSLALHSIKRWNVPDANDFNVFYTAGKLVNGGHPVAVYANRTVFAAEAHLSGGHRFHMPFVNPPDFSFIMSLFAHLPFFPAYYLWTGVNAAAFVAAGIIALGHVPSRLRVPSALLLAGCLPVVVAITQGQVSGLIALGFTLALEGFRRPVLLLPAVVMLSIKPQLAIVILAVVLVRRSRLEWTYTALGLLTAGALGMAAGGFAAYRAFIRQTAHMAGSTTGAHWGAADNFSILSQLQTFLGYGTASRVAWVLCSAAVLGAFLWTMFGRKDIPGVRVSASSVDVPWLACAAVTVLIANHLQYHDLTLLYPAAIVAIGTKQYKFALGVLAAVWLDPILYPPTHVHLVVLACAATLVMWALSEYRPTAPAATMDGNSNRSGHGYSWKSLKRRRWDSASESGTPLMS